VSKHFESSRALWNRTSADLESAEVLAQLMDRGDLDDWRMLFRLAREDARLRARLKRVILTSPTPLPHFWLAALQSLGESVDWSARIPDYFESTTA